jgi:hypothetical protein
MAGHIAVMETRTKKGFHAFSEADAMFHRAVATKNCESREGH